MKYIEAPIYDKVETDNSIFLAGGITGVENWQEKAINKLKDVDDLTIINPRRKDFEAFKNASGFKESEIQIRWEYYYIREATQVMFWFSYETLQPIALFELGSRLQEWHSKDLGESSQEIFIGIHPNYQRKFDLLVQIPLLGYVKENIYDSLDKLLDRVVVYNNNLKYFKNDNYV